MLALLWRRLELVLEYVVERKRMDDLVCVCVCVCVCFQYPFFRCVFAASPYLTVNTRRHLAGKEHGRRPL
jgi:hypothetical protein